MPTRAAAMAVPSRRRRRRVDARAGPVFSRVRIWTVSKYGPAADALASDRRSVGEWPWATCRGGSVAAAAAIAVGEAAPAMVGQMVYCGLSGGGKSCARRIRLLFRIMIKKINSNGLFIQNMTFFFGPIFAGRLGSCRGRTYPLSC